MHRSDRLDVERETRAPHRLARVRRRAMTVARDLELGHGRALRRRERHLEMPARARWVDAHAGLDMLGERCGLQQSLTRDRSVRFR